MRSTFVCSFIIAMVAIAAQGDEPQKKIIWQGTLHLGDSPEKYAGVASGGMVLQVPCALEPGKKGRLTIVTRDVQTLAGDGHYAELLAHYEDGDAPAREYVVETWRLKDDTPDTDVEKVFDFDPLKGLSEALPAYYSVRIRIDNTIKFTLWDDFLVKKIEVQQ